MTGRGRAHKPGKGWDCEAYGPGLLGELGDLCFYGEIEECTSQAQCHARMASERRRVFQRINELAASGDPTGEFLAAEFTNPSQILGTDDADDAADAADEGADSSAEDGQAPVPVLYLTQQALFTWEQHAPGGCRCVCRLYHGGQGACLEPAEPGRLLRVVAPTSPWTPADITDPLQICAACYDAIALANGQPPDPDDGEAGDR